MEFQYTAPTHHFCYLDYKVQTCERDVEAIYRDRNGSFFVKRGDYWVPATRVTPKQNGDPDATETVFVTREFKESGYEA